MAKIDVTQELKDLQGNPITEPSKDKDGKTVTINKTVRSVLVKALLGGNVMPERPAPEGVTPAPSLTLDKEGRYDLAKQITDKDTVVITTDQGAFIKKLLYSASVLEYGQLSKLLV